MFLHPWALVMGVLAVGLPVLIHRLTRPRPKLLPISTIRFIQDAIKQRRARHRLRDFIVLALRTLAVILIALALARPLTNPREPVAESGDAKVVRVVLVDTSQSMATRVRGIETFERGRPLASRLLDYQTGLRADLILAAARPRAVFGTPSTNFSALQDELASASPRPEKLNVQAALNLASELLSRSGTSKEIRRELIIVSDFQRTNWANADFSVLPTDVEIQLQSVASAEPASNLALLGVKAQGRAEVGQELRLEIEVGNYSPTLRQVTVEVSLGDGVYQVKGTCAPHSKTTLTSDILPRETGWLTGEARIVGIEDALPADNVRPCVLQVRTRPLYVLITRQPENRRPSSSYFLERGLIPIEPKKGTGQSRLVRLEASKLDPQVLGAADLIVLDHPGRLPSEAIKQLAALLRRGRGILYVASEQIDATNLKLLSDAAGAGLQMPVEFLPVSATASRRDLHLTEPRRDRPPFSIFGDDLDAAIGPLRFAGGLSTRKMADALEDDILASLSDRSALLVVTSSDAGSLAVLNADLGTSNLHQSPIFVPLLAELVQNHLLNRRQGIRETVCGESFVVDLPSSAGSSAGLKLSGPATRTVMLGELTQEAHGVVWSASVVEETGIYRVMRRDNTEYALAVSIPGEEADLRVLDESVFKERLSAGRSIQYRSLQNLGGEENDSLWIWLAIACMVCLMGEVMTLKLFRT